MLDTNKGAEGFVHPPEQVKDTEAMTSTFWLGSQYPNAGLRTGLQVTSY
jgi:hypothetical protein